MTKYRKPTRESLMKSFKILKKYKPMKGGPSRIQVIKNIHEDIPGEDDPTHRMSQREIDRNYMKEYLKKIRKKYS